MGLNITQFIIKNRIWVILGAILVVVIGIAILAFNTRLCVARYEVKTKKVTRAVKIVLIADLHSCYWGAGEADLLNAVYAEKPDIVLFGGDIFDDILPPENSQTVMKALSERYPCYYVSGNHEYLTYHVESIKQTVRDLGVSVLAGTCDTIEINGQKINICGIDDASAGDAVMAEQLSEAEKEAEKDAYTVLLTHRPEYIDNYLPYDFDLILAGHTHGGQVRIPLVLNGLFAPNQGWFPKYAGGAYSFGKKTMIISRGLSRESTNFPRIFDPPELDVIDITPQDKAE